MKGAGRAVKARRSWAINPKTRVKESDRVYRRPLEKRRTKKAIDLN
jgi:hypothetical protein